MKRYGFLYEQITDLENIRLAHHSARKGKAHYTEVKWVNDNEDLVIRNIQELLITQTFTTSQYTTKTITDRHKSRNISVLPYYPDRIVHHAMIQILGPIWQKGFIRDTFQSLPRRGTHDVRKRIEKYLSGNRDGQYFTKIDIHKFYPSIDNGILKTKIARKIKDPKVLWLLDDIIDSHQGIPIGNYTSQFLGNLYLNEFDWWSIQNSGVSSYFRYCDDILAFSRDPEVLCWYNENTKTQVNELNLSINEPLKTERLSQRKGVYFVGYRYNDKSIYLRKTIWNGIKTSQRSRKQKSLVSYWGWVKPLRHKYQWRYKI